MDTDSHPYVIDAHAEGTPSKTAQFLVGTAVEAGLDPTADVQRVTRPEAGFRITEALAAAVDGALEGQEPPLPDTHDEDGFPLDGGPHGRDKPEDWLALSEDGKRAFVYDAAPEPDLSGNKQSLAPEHDIHAEPTEVAYQDWDYADLKSAVSTKGIETPDKKQDTLIAALVAYDKSLAEQEPEAEQSA